MNTIRNGLFGLLISLTGCAAYYPQAGGYGYGQGYGYAVGFPAPVYSAFVAPAVSVGYRAPVYAPAWRGGPEHGGHESRGQEHRNGYSPREHHRG